LQCRDWLIIDYRADAEFKDERLKKRIEEIRGTRNAGMFSGWARMNAMSRYAG
jgi:hypothetical protein